jgi:hypothetical protein
MLSKSTTIMPKANQGNLLDDGDKGIAYNSF